MQNEVISDMSDHNIDEFLEAGLEEFDCDEGHGADDIIHV